MRNTCIIGRAKTRERYRFGSRGRTKRKYSDLVSVSLTALCEIRQSKSQYVLYEERFSTEREVRVRFLEACQVKEVVVLPKRVPARDKQVISVVDDCKCKKKKKKLRKKRVRYVVGHVLLNSRAHCNDQFAECHGIQQVQQWKSLILRDKIDVLRVIARSTRRTDQNAASRDLLQQTFSSEAILFRRSTRCDYILLDILKYWRRMRKL